MGPSSTQTLAPGNRPRGASDSYFTVSAAGPAPSQILPTALTFGTPVEWLAEILFAACKRHSPQADLNTQMVHLQRSIAVYVLAYHAPPWLTACRCICSTIAHNSSATLSSIRSSMEYLGSCAPSRWTYSVVRAPHTPSSLATQGYLTTPYWRT